MATTTEPIDIDQHDFLVATEMVRKYHGDAAVIGEPYRDTKGQIWAPVTKNEKYVDEVFLGKPRPPNLDNLLGKTVREPDNKAYNDLIVALDAKFREALNASTQSKHDAGKQQSTLRSDSSQSPAAKQPTVASKSREALDVKS